jgi:hypothetical protein
MKSEETIMKKEILNKVKKANYCFVWCVLDSYDVGYYFRTSKTEVLFYVRKYLKNNSNLENLNNAVVLREDGDLYIN